VTCAPAPPLTGRGAVVAPFKRPEDDGVGHRRNRTLRGATLNRYEAITIKAKADAARPVVTATTWYARKAAA
jgi:hypothetical protein